MRRTKTPSRILFLDIETAPNVGYTWGKFEQNVIEFVEPWYILSFAYAWGDAPVQVVGLADFPGYRPKPGADKPLIRILHRLFDQADIIVAHNGKQFDIRKVNYRFVHHKFPPPSPYKVVDTRMSAKSVWFDSYGLDSMAAQLKLGRKVKHCGFPLWLACMAGQRAAWRKMKFYNRRDVVLLRRLYKRLLGWMRQHPNVADVDRVKHCPRCNSDRLQSRGVHLLKTMSYKRFQCQNCGRWCRLNIDGKKILRNTSDIG